MTEIERLDADRILDQVDGFLRTLLAIDEESSLEQAALADLRTKLATADPDDVPYLLETIEAVLVTGRLRDEKRKLKTQIAQAVEVARFAVGLVALL